MPPPVQLLFIVLALVVFWALVMRPARKQQQSVQKLQSEIAVGDRVVISAGIFGTVLSHDGPTVELEVAPGTVLTVARQVVVRRADEVVDSTAEADPAAEADEHGHPPDHRPESQD